MIVGSRVLGSHFRAGSAEPMMMEGCNDMDEGETSCYYKLNGGDVDPDIALSYIGEKLQRVLGHLQKDFEGGVSAEKLGAKFGGYGSFLPTYERPPSNLPHKIHQQRDCHATQTLDNVPLKGFSQNPNVPPPERPEATICNTFSSHNTRETSDIIAGKTDSCVPSTKVTNGCPSKDEPSSRLGNPMNRSLKVRIKVGSDTALKNAAIYSGLGLDDSPTSSSENSSDVSEGMLPISQSPPDESPTKIIQAMTSFPVPHGALISPLHDSLIYLSRKEKPFRETKPAVSLEDQKEGLAKQVNEIVLIQNEGKLIKKKKEVRHGERQEKTTFMNRKSEIEGKDFPPNELQRKPVADSNHNLHNLKPSWSAPKVSLCKKDDRILEISGQDRLKSGSKLRIKDAKALEQKEENSENYVLATNLGDDQKYKTVKTSLEDPSEGTMCNAYLDPQKKKLSCETTLHGTDKDKVSTKREKSGTIGKKKRKLLQTPGVKIAGSFEEGFKIGSGAPKGRKDTDSETPEFENRRHRLKLPSNEKVAANNRDSVNSSGFDQNCKSKDVIERASGDLQKAILDDRGIGKSKFRNETKERRNSSKMNVHLTSGVSSKDGQGASSLVIDNDRFSKVAEPAVVAPVVIEEDWVCCDRCQKWRLLPFGVKPQQLPDKWLCSMLNWLPGMNRCDISEQETTEKLYALYQQPLGESGDVLQNYANGPTVSATSNQGKKRETLKKMQNPVSSIGHAHAKSSLKNQQQESRKSQQQESRKRKSLNGLSNPPNQLRNSLDQSSSKLHNLVEGKNRSKLKEKFVDREQQKMKNKKPEDSSFHFEVVKHSKTDDMRSIDKHQDVIVDLGKLGSSSNSGLTNMEGGEGMLKHGDIGLMKHDKFNTVNKMQISLKKREKTAEISSGVKSFVKVSDSCTKKRKSKDWQDDQNSHNSALHEGVHVKEENCERPKKKKKSHVLNDSHKINGGDFTKGMEEISEDKEQKMKNKKIVPKQTSAGKELLKKNLGVRQVSATAYSSSNVSPSHLTKAKFGMKVFPAESVSSSPMRTSGLDQFGGEKEEITSNIHSDSHKVSPMFGFGVKDTALNTSSKKIKPSPEVQHRFLTADTNTAKQLSLYSNHMDDNMEPSSKKLKKVLPDKEFSTEKKNGINQFSHQLITDAPKSDDAVESITLKNSGNAGNKNEMNHRYKKQPDLRGSRDVNASNLDRMKSSNQTACDSTLKEAKDLKDSADRLKSSRSGFESNEVYFQSAIKYLHGAFLLETFNNASGKHGDMTHMQFYGNSAELCGNCALEYERRQEMAAAALAYKCIEVAYLRIVYHKHSSINGVLHEMHSLRSIAEGESPSSSASDVDNLSNQVVDKATCDKVGGSLTGNHISNAGSSTSFARLLDFAHDMNSAMEASRKSRNAFMAASSYASETKNVDYVASVKKVIDFSFQDVEELVRLVRVAMEKIAQYSLGFSQR